MSAKRVFRCLWRCLCAVLCGVLVLLLAAQGYLAAARLIAKKSNPTIFGFQSAVVLTGSMSGAIEAGDLILVHAEKEYYSFQRARRHARDAPHRAKNAAGLCDKRRRQRHGGCRRGFAGADSRQGCFGCAVSRQGSAVSENAGGAFAAFYLPACRFVLVGHRAQEKRRILKAIENGKFEGK